MLQGSYHLLFNVLTGTASQRHVYLTPFETVFQLVWAIIMCSNILWYTTSSSIIIPKRAVNCTQVIQILVNPTVAVAAGNDTVGL